MSRRQKIITSVLWSTVVLAMIGMAVTGQFSRSGGQADDVLFSIAPFELIDHRGQLAGDKTLQGKPWVAMVMFTRCKMACPRMVARMQQIEQAVPSSDLKLVSVTVDPDHDTPPVLNAFVQQYAAQPDRWLMLTGTKARVYDVAEGVLKLNSGIADGGLGHSEKMLLIDRRNQVRGIYDTNDDQDIQRLIADASRLIKVTR